MSTSMSMGWQRTHIQADLVCLALTPASLACTAQHLSHNACAAGHNCPCVTTSSYAAIIQVTQGLVARHLPVTCQYLEAQRSTQLFSPTFRSPSLYLHASEARVKVHSLKNEPLLR